MAKYRVEIVETLRTVVEIEADTEQQAIDNARYQYDNNDIVLECDDYVGTEINVVKNEKER